MEYTIGIDLGGTTINIGAVSPEGKVLRESVLCTDPKAGALNAISRIQGAINEFEVVLGKGSSNKNIVVGMPGIIDQKNGTIIKAGNLPGWDNFPFGEALSFSIQKNVIIKNDADLAALGEVWVGAGESFNDAFMITLGSGIGGALIRNKKLFELNNISGEFGHMVVNLDGALCSCGKRGCVETYFSRYGLERITRERLGRQELLGNTKVEDITPLILAEQAKENNPVALEILKEGIDGLATGIANICNLIGVTDYIIGGGISNAWDIFNELLAESVKKQILDSEKRNITLVKAILKEKAGIIGAAKFEMDLSANKMQYEQLN